MAHKRLKGRKGQKMSSARKTIKRNVKADVERQKRKQAKEQNSEDKPEADGKVAALKKPRLINLKASVEKAMTTKEIKAREKMARLHRSQYDVGERILLVGEANFSFARALCRNLESGAGVYATTYDDEAVLKKKYPDVEECRRELQEKFGATTLVGVDATRIHKVKEFRHAFRKIIWNFPHIGGGETDVDQSIADHRVLLAGFFASASKCLEQHPKSAIHIALKAGEPYKSWKIVPTARGACEDLDVRTALPFVPEAWPGYAHRRTAGFDERHSKKESEELAKGAKVYVFCRRQVQS